MCTEQFNVVPLKSTEQLIIYNAFENLLQMYETTTKKKRKKRELSLRKIRGIYWALTHKATTPCLAADYIYIVWLIV